MAEEDKSFAALVAEAPPAPAEGVVSLVGTLARSSEHGKFVLILQDGQTITLETAAVKGHAVLGASLGRTIVRVDVDAGKVPAISPEPSAPGAISPLITVVQRDVNTYLEHTLPASEKPPFIDAGKPAADKLVRDNTDKLIRDNTKSLQDQKDPYLDDGGFLAAGGVAPFALATPHQAPANVVGAMNPFGAVSNMRKIPGSDTNAYRDYIDTGGGIDVIVLRTPY